MVGANLLTISEKVENLERFRLLLARGLESAPIKELSHPKESSRHHERKKIED
jgi:hypothetical protein